MKPPHAKYQRFVFKDYDFDPGAKTLELTYGMDDALEFKEIYKFDFDYAAYDPNVLDRALQNLFFMAGVSYYKAYIPPTIVVEKGKLDPDLASFFSKTYQRGLGEFWYVNNLDPRTLVTFPADATKSQVHTPGHLGAGLLASVGGGKDSLVTIELLRGHNPQPLPDPLHHPKPGQPGAPPKRVNPKDLFRSSALIAPTPVEKPAPVVPHGAPLMTWSLSHRPQLTPLVKRIGLPHCWVERTWDPQLQSLNKQDALNGHVPISAIFACVGTVVAILAGKRDVVMSNEQSANEPTLVYQGVEINHQYSKSQEFERNYQTALKHCFGDGLRYYSLLRPLSELHIAELFAKLAFHQYKDVFSSCNRAYVHTSDRMSWCGECPKCAFTFLVLTPFIKREELEKLWGGKNLLLDPGLEPTYQQLLGIAGDKPLECVGEIKESRAAMQLAQTPYPTLLTYRFELPDSYDYKAIGSSSMPEEMLRLLITQI
jgi:UDP-N-acetyl-alpha-D-muramoyl-L-alanyl-L-glutamate epimerase